MSQPSAVPKIFRVEENDGDCDVVPEVSDHVLREGEHLGQLGMVNAVRGATKGVSDQVSGGVGVAWFEFHGSLASPEHEVDV